MGKPRTGRWGVALGSTAIALTVTSGCSPYGFYSGTGVHDATVAELAGTWNCIEGTQVTLRRDGTAVFQRLDGADFAFDDGWRLSGNGTWRLTDGDDGQEIRLALNDRTGIEYRTDHTRDATSVSVPPPTTYTWDLYVDRDKDRRLWLFFFYSDPDAGNRYVLSRPRA
ncbi:hypothetical protein ACIHAR_27995 [Streptomyces sp. NPDC052016]|uniref:hypothetical protein n=1 Tax=Streptomyces sp. NPDC052016 TaxID=3365680 RepID=UPI0037CE6666